MPKTETQVALAAHYDTLAPGYDADFADPVARAEDRLVIGALRDAGINEVSVKRLLDIGSGTGLLLDYMDFDPSQYRGVDISRGMIEQAARKHPHHTFKHSAIEDYPLGYGWDTVVSLFGSFSHVAQPITQLQRIWAAMQPGGIIALHLLSKRREHRTDHGVPLAEPTIFYSAESARDVLRLSGFGKITVRGLSGYAAKTGAYPAMWLEAQTLGRWHPDTGYFLFVTGQKTWNSRALYATA